MEAGVWKWAAGTPLLAWQRCDPNGANCVPIQGASGSTYELTADDVGKTIEVIVTAPGFHSPTVLAVQATPVVRPAVPANVNPPSIQGTVAVGGVLTASTGDWAQPAPALSYAWEQCADDGTACSPIAGATGQTYTIQASDAGWTLRVTVTATNATGTASAVSTQTAVVPPPAPANVAVPLISGDLVVGSVLTTDLGSWSDPQAGLAVVWERCAADGSGCAPIDGATAASYTLTGDDLGSTLEVVVTATDAGGSASAASAATGVVTAPAG
jgi:hypothetical protein